MSGFADIHCHLLPGLDDGPCNREESLQMLGIAKADGVEAIVATPHILEGVYDNTRRGIEEAVLSFSEGKRQYEGISLFAGADVRVCHDLIKKVENGRIALINGGNYLLLELPYYSMPPVVYLENVVSALKMRGITAVITHPERNWGFLSWMELMKRLIRLGAIFQLTAGSLTGIWGNTVRKAALKMVREDCAHVVASDAHDPKRRPPVLSEAYAEVARKIGPGAADALFIENPRRIIEASAVVYP